MENEFREYKNLPQRHYYSGWDMPLYDNNQKAWHINRNGVTVKWWKR
jgi:hypothetical protein